MPNAVARAYESLLNDILSGAYPVGGRLREEELAASIGTSRTPVREALRRLHAEGLVQVLPNRGAIVVDLSDEELDDIFELRFLLEGHGARRAATRATPEQVATLAKLCDEMERCLERTDAERFDDISRFNLEFHGTLHEAGGNPRLAPLISGLMLMPLVRRTFSRYTPEQLNRSFAHHRELVAAIEARDGTWAEAVMHAHTNAGRNSLGRDDSADQPDLADLEERADA